MSRTMRMAEITEGFGKNVVGIAVQQRLEQEGLGRTWEGKN